MDEVSRNSYNTLSSLGADAGANTGAIDDSSKRNGVPLKLSLAVVRARAARRTEFALQVIAASQAALEATDALLAASDALVAAPKPSSSTSAAISCGEYVPAASAPEACEASDDSESDTQSSHDVYAIMAMKTPEQKQHQKTRKFSQKKQLPQLQQQQQQQQQKQPSKKPESSDSPVLEQAEEQDFSESSPSGSSTSSHVESASEGRSVSRSSRAASVQFLSSGRQTPSSLADLPISSSLVSGSFVPKVPIPKFITSLAESEQSALLLPIPMTANPTVGNLQKVPPKGKHENTQKDEDAESDDGLSSSNSENSSSGDSSADDSGDSDDSAIDHTPNATESPDIEADQYVNNLLEGLQGSQEPTAVLNISPPQTHQQSQSQPSGLSLEASAPSAVILTSPLVNQPPAVPPFATTSIPIVRPITVPAASRKASPLISPLHVADEVSSSEDGSEDDSDSASGSSGSDAESDTDRPSISEAPSVAPSDNPSDTTTRSVSSNIENDDYVAELLNELRITKEGPKANAEAILPAPRIPVATGTAETLLVAPRTATGRAKPAKVAPPLLAPRALELGEKEENEELDSSDSQEESDDSSDDEGSSEASSSSEDGTGSSGEENDEYVDELLKELNSTKPSSLIPPQNMPFPAPKKVPTKSIDNDCSVSDDEISDIVSSSSSDYDSSDSEMFSSDDDEDDDEEGSGDLGEAYASSDENTSEDEDDNYVDDLLNELQAPRVIPPKPAATKPAADPAQPSPGMPGIPPGMPMGLPGEGLNLDAIRSELEKVGRAVMTQKSGEKFVARAQILASINQLASHVPNCVLDFLGKEVKANLARKKAKENEKPETKEERKSRKMKMIDFVSQDDDKSEVSALSELDISEKDEDTNAAFLIDTSGVNLGGKEEEDTAGGSQQEKAPAPSLMRQKSHEALDKMFKEAREDGSVANLSQGLDINEIFNASNEYGLTTSKASHSMASSMSSSVGSNSGKPKSKSVAGMSGMSWGTNLKGKLPSVSKFECSLLFIDISGFTKLSTLLDPETLSKVINSYFQLIVSKVYEFNGDIQKFAGDAIFAEWRCSEKASMEFCVAAATACASQIVNECSDFPVMAGGVQSKSGAAISSLNVHCALGSGQMIGIHVGDHTRRREYLFLGEPIDQLTWGADLAKHGEFVVSPEAFRSLSRAGVLDFKIRPSESEPAIIAKRGVTMFKSEKLEGYRTSRIELAMSRGVTGHVEGLEVEDLRTYQKLMALYVHPVVAAIHMDQKSKMKTKSSAQERHREEAELRRVYIMFIHPLIEISEDNDFAVDQLNEIMNLTSTQLERYCGHLRQMIVDDKGLVLIGTFGLRGSTFPNMVAERALPATIALHNALQSQLGVDNRIGATFGEVYCGAVGGVKRHEYAVLGPSANLAARLMGSKDNPGILVECNIRRMASRKYAFNALPPVKAKGYSEPVPIFEPLSPLERSWGRIQPNFVGREPEIKALMGMARSIVGAEEPHSRLVFVASQSGMGKSTMVAHAIEHTRNMIGDDARRLVITKHVGKESSSLLPFGMFRSILLDVLANFASSSDDKSLASGVSGFTSSQSLSLQSLSCKSHGSSLALSLAKSEELLKVLCRELNTPGNFVDHLLHNLSGKSGGKLPTIGGKTPSMKAMVSFMSRAFRRCTQETKLVVVALDDVQYIDEMTWKVLRQVFEGCENVLMICAFDLSRSRDLKVESDFWQVLNSKYRPAGHFVPMELAGLGKEEITLMTMKTLGLQRDEISSDLLNEVHIQSGGMPHFANEFLELVKRKQFTEMMEARMEGRPSVTAGPKAFAPSALGSVPEIILHRIDAFDVAVRNILNIAAVLGKSFSLKEVIDVLKESHDMREDVILEEAVAALNMAISEGILREEVPDDESEDSDEDQSKMKGNEAVKDAKEAKKSERTVYAFYHSVWQSTILSLMLDARKRDVHMNIAASMEKEMKKDGSDFAFQMKLLGHWKASGNTAKLSELALDVGKHFEQNLGLPSQSIRIFEEALDAWKDDKPSDYVGGLSPEVLNAAEPEDLVNISSLHVALGRAFNGANRHADSALSFHDALRILRDPRNAEKVTDRAVAFPAYLGLYVCVKGNYITQEGSSKRYEQLLIKKFLDDSKNHEEIFHHVQAITCQIDLFLRNGDMKKVVAVQSLLYKIYDHEQHTKKLRETYGSDEAASTFSNSAMWHWELGDKAAALDACRFVIGKLMPKMDRSDVHQSFVVMYPVVLVMKSYDVAVQARKHFERLVVKPFSAFFGEGKSSFFLPVYEPIMMLLHLSGSPDDLDEDTLEEYAEWALDRDRLCFGTLANRRLGALGRCADSLSAEICFLLAEHIEEDETRRVLIEHGKDIGQEALFFNKSQGLKLAQQQVEMLLSNYEPLMAELDGGERYVRPERQVPVKPATKAPAAVTPAMLAGNDDNGEEEDDSNDSDETDDSEEDSDETDDSDEESDDESDES